MHLAPQLRQQNLTVNCVTAKSVYSIGLRPPFRLSAFHLPTQLPTQVDSTLFFPFLLFSCDNFITWPMRFDEPSHSTYLGWIFDCKTLCKVKANFSVLSRHSSAFFFIFLTSYFQTTVPQFYNN